MIIFCILIFYISFGLIFFILNKKKLELNSIFFLFAFLQIFWLFYRIFRVKNGIPETLILPFIFYFLITITFIKYVFLAKPSETITNFFILLYKKPFQIFHETMKKTLPFYNKLIQNSIGLFEYIYENKDLFYTLILYFPFILINTIFIFEICYYHSIYYSLWLFPIGFLFQQIINITFFFIEEHLEEKIKYLSMQNFNKRVIKEIKVIFGQKQDALEEKYKFIFLNQKFILVLQEIITIKKHKLFLIYSFLITVCFIQMHLKNYSHQLYILFLCLFPVIFLIFLLLFIFHISEEEKTLQNELIWIFKEKKWLLNNFS
jgi:hypothetical protein